MTPEEAVTKWLDDKFNQVIVADYAPCPVCGAAPGADCTDEAVTGVFRHALRFNAGEDVLRRVLIERRADR